MFFKCRQACVYTGGFICALHTVWCFIVCMRVFVYVYMHACTMFVSHFVWFGISLFLLLSFRFFFCLFDPFSSAKVNTISEIYLFGNTLAKKIEIENRPLIKHPKNIGSTPPHTSYANETVESQISLKRNPVNVSLSAYIQQPFRIFGF